MNLSDKLSGGKDIVKNIEKIYRILITKKPRFYDFFLIFIFALIISFPLITDGSVLKTNDMMGNVVNLVYIKKTLLESGVFPHWNPFLHQGIPIVADPLNTFFNPLVSVTIIM